MADKGEKQPNMDSSVVIRALDATFFSEMEAFVKDLETRPVERIIRDLPDLAALSEAKFSLCSRVLISKYRAASEAERSAIKKEIETLLGGMPAGEASDRIRNLLKKM